MAHVLGWRKGELLDLRVRDIRLGENCIRLEESKNNNKREVPLTLVLRTFLEPMVVGRKPEDRLFGFVTISKASRENDETGWLSRSSFP